MMILCGCGLPGVSASQSECVAKRRLIKQFSFTPHLERAAASTSQVNDLALPNCCLNNSREGAGNKKAPDNAGA